MNKILLNSVLLGLSLLGINFFSGPEKLESNDTAIKKDCSLGQQKSAHDEDEMVDLSCFDPAVHIQLAGPHAPRNEW